MDSKKKQGSPLRASDISLFCSQVSLILRAGIPLPDGIGEMWESMQGKEGKALILNLKNSLDRNGSLFTALDETGAFPAYMIHMVNIGEKAGRLDEVMEALSLYYDREAKLSRRVRSAVLYPFLLILMMAAVIAVLLIRVLPVFYDVFLDMGSDLADFSGAVLRTGMAIGETALTVIGILAVLLLLVLILSKTQAGSRGLAYLAVQFGPARRISDKIASARFASVMSMMLSSGYDTTEALRLIPGIISSRAMTHKICACRDAVNAGAPFARAVEDAKIFPGIYSGMVSIGAKTGSLDSVMKKLAELYSEDVDESVSRAVSLIEPALAAILSLVVGAILLAVMLPLMGIMSSLG